MPPPIPKENKTEGIFVFRIVMKAEICLFLFKKLAKKQMDVALPAPRMNNHKLIIL